MQTEATRAQVVSVVLFFLFLGALLLGSLYITGGLEGYMTEREQVHIAFHESVTGLRVGSPVSLSGVTVGRVVSIEPMASSKARALVKDASVLVPPRKNNGVRNPGRIIPGSQFLTEQDPVVLVTAKIKENSIPLNRKTRVSLITTNVTGTQAVRFSAGSRKSIDRLTRQVVVNADPSPLATLRSRFLDEETNGVFQQKNIEHLNALIQNLRTVSDQLAEITGKTNRKNIHHLLSRFDHVASTLGRWVSPPADCPEHGVSLQVKKIQRDGKSMYRYRCPESGKKWVEKHPPSQKGQLTRTIDRMNQLLDRLNDMVQSDSGKADLTGLIRNVRTLAGNLNQTVQNINGLVTDNRERIGTLVRNVNRLSEKVNRIATQLDQEPSSAVFGRQGNEIRTPYERRSK